MLALFFGTAALPHILIRYYTVKNRGGRQKVYALLRLSPSGFSMS